MAIAAGDFDSSMVLIIGQTFVNLSPGQVWKAPQRCGSLSSNTSFWGYSGQWRPVVRRETEPGKSQRERLVASIQKSRTSTGASRFL
jgi:hypothetical protein